MLDTESREVVERSLYRQRYVERNACRLVEQPRRRSASSQGMRASERHIRKRLHELAKKHPARATGA